MNNAGNSGKRAGREANTTNDEIVDLVDTSGAVTGSVPRSKVHGNPALLHPVVHVHIINSRNEILLQKRAASKQVQPDKWDTAVGGHIISGESVQEALAAEMQEELGIAPENVLFLFSYVHSNVFESEFVYVHLMRHEGPFCVDPEEVAEVRFWHPVELESVLGDGGFTPNFVDEYPMLKPYIGSTPHAGQ